MAIDVKFFQLLTAADTVHVKTKLELPHFFDYYSKAILFFWILYIGLSGLANCGINSFVDWIPSSQSDIQPFMEIHQLKRKSQSASEILQIQHPDRSRLLIGIDLSLCRHKYYWFYAGMVGRHFLELAMAHR